MHRYLDAVGYGEMASFDELNRFLERAKETCIYQEVVSLDPETDFCEYVTSCTEKANIGISVCGTLDLKGGFQRHYFFPYLVGNGITSISDVTVEKRMDKMAFAGIFEDDRVGISLIFHVLNSVEYMTVHQSKRKELKQIGISLSGLCNGGMILLPVAKNPEQERAKKENNKNRINLLNAARGGDHTAIETLTLNDIETYSKVSRRLATEDVFTIVETYFMPCGIECDQYSILGEIVDMKTTRNMHTDEELYILTVQVNGITFDVCVPAKNVVGEPMVGRRFKGDIWLQGIIGA